jgi:G:T-mismatch repair DNA endonuclease (very short patch repair protein)
MKLGRNIESDREDVKYLAHEGHINSDESRRRYECEMRPYIGSPETNTDRVIEFWLELIHEDLERLRSQKT